MKFGLNLWDCERVGVSSEVVDVLSEVVGVGKSDAMADSKAARPALAQPPPTGPQAGCCMRLECVHGAFKSCTLCAGRASWCLAVFWGQQSSSISGAQHIRYR